MNSLNEQQLSAILLLLSCLIFLVAGMMFTMRVIWSLPMGQSEIFLRWERGMVVAGFVTSLLGFGLLENILRSAGDIGWGPWCAETGWGHTWIGTALGLREKDDTLWNLLSKHDITQQWEAIHQEMLREIQ